MKIQSWFAQSWTKALGFMIVSSLLVAKRPFWTRVELVPGMVLARKPYLRTFVP